MLEYGMATMRALFFVTVGLFACASAGFAAGGGSSDGLRSASCRSFCNPLSIPDIPIGFLCRDVANGTPFPTEAGWRRDFWERRQAREIMSTRQFREIADPVVYVDGNRWYLYPSLGLLWVSEDFGGTWSRKPVQDRCGYAPAVVRCRGKFFFCTSGGPLQVSDSPTGPFATLGRFDLKSFSDDPRMPGTLDPAFWSDGDRLYLYWGCCAKPKSLWGVELDPEQPLRAKVPGSAVCLMEYDAKKYPWLTQLIEGVWVFKRGKYFYLAYSTANAATPDYQWCVSKGLTPLGPFVPQKENPVFRTSEGVVTGTGHGSIWCDRNGDWWINYGIYVGAYNGIERLIGQDRIDFDADGDIVVRSASDTPQWLPASGRKGETGWKALALKSGYGAMTDGKLVTWSVLPQAPCEVELTLANRSRVESVRLVWRDLGLDTVRGIHPAPRRYRVDRILDGRSLAWVDASDNDRELMVDYREGESALADAIRLRVLSVPHGMETAVAELTVFGTALGTKGGFVMPDPSVR